MKTAIFDIETNGFLDALTKIHVLIIRDFENAKTRVFRHNDSENSIEQGVRLLEQAEFLVGHNICHFDIPAIEKIYPDFSFSGKIRDTLVMTRLIYSDEKERDFDLWNRGMLPGKLIGSHSLEAWGYRLRMHKGDYAKNMEEQGLDPWAAWNQPMEDYCAQDTLVTETLYKKIVSSKYPESAIVFEHQIHDLMGRQERNGFPFDSAAAENLAIEMQKEVNALSEKVVKHFGIFYAPARKKQIKPLWDNPEDNNIYQKPNKALGEDDSRAIWADVKIPKKTLFYKDPTRPDLTAGAAYCPIVRKEFNPSSRDQIIDRFTTNYNWQPSEFTDKGRPSVDDDVLRNLSGKIPMALELAEIFYYTKRLGQIRDGKQAWLKQVAPDGKIHHYCNVGGTVSGRASHTGPNLAQVPRVVARKETDPQTGKKKTVLLTGRDGDHGWDCRNLFYVPAPFKLMGCDLSGIEFRCLANRAARHDNGALIDIILNGDIHEVNRVAAGLDSRDTAKTLIYAMIYGGGDWKLGTIVAPQAPEHDKKRIGADVRRRLETNVQGLGYVVREVQEQAKKKFLYGLDGRYLMVRGMHSALNLQLQSDGALIAKKWVVLFEQYMEDHGLVHSWQGDFAQLAWIHDEIQVAVHEKYADLACELAIKAAADAGKYFNFQCPVDAEAKIGKTWAETH